MKIDHEETRSADILGHGILRVSETETAEIEAARAFVMINVASEKILFGNAAVAASEDLKSVVAKIITVSENVEVDTEAVSLTTNSGLLSKNSTANYTIRLTVNDLNALGAILGICSEGKKISVRSVIWDYEEDEAKLGLIKSAIRKAKRKADEMMAEIGYSVIGIRSCSDSYQTPNIGEIIISRPDDSRFDDTMESARRRAGSAVDFGAQFKSKKQISATCTIEFLVREAPTT
jgi:Protein of unknown function (DUF541)